MKIAFKQSIRDFAIMIRIQKILAFSLCFRKFSDLSELRKGVVARPVTFGCDRAAPTKSTASNGYYVHLKYWKYNHGY